MLFYNTNTKLLCIPNSSLQSFFLPSFFFCLWVNLVLKSLSVFRLREQYYKTFKGTRLVLPVLFLCFLFSFSRWFFCFFPRKKSSFLFILLMFISAMTNNIATWQSSTYYFTTISFQNVGLLLFFWCHFINHPAVPFSFLLVSNTEVLCSCLFPFSFFRD